MLNRRTMLGFAAALAFAGTAQAQDWKAQYPELTLGVIPAENASGTVDRYTPLTDYLSKELGVKVTLRVANDYAAVIEGQRAGNIQIAFYGPASYARAIITGVATEPVVVQRHNTGLTGYYSVVYVRADSPYKTMDDLKGKKIALVDPNSTSGNNAPRYFLNKAGYTVDTFFGSNVYAGSHDNAVLALAQGTVDAAANSWNSEHDSNLTRMLTKGILKNADGTPMKLEDFRIVFKSDLLPEGPFSVLSALPADLKKQITDAFLAMPKKDKAGFDKLSDGKDIEFVATKPADYEGIIGMVKYNDEARKKS
ncbi:phosphonate ABC transporter substrate-binding protein [Labrys wisconsinensis]|uniref:Phosphonate transport system substrate-binding protein n=1 Tax=Labrys wisconsinensis TaxID=425677 RepID=A0ABU0JC94_9HYPH|nr:phosphonate ABC transporter substrate-binding protein [Labrys wisconsinensis]MDQ0471210.1 phosphonate transport system substrate-binding protein [Labrys wisconsinensis]